MTTVKALIYSQTFVEDIVHNMTQTYYEMFIYDYNIIVTSTKKGDIQFIFEKDEPRLLEENYYESKGIKTVFSSFNAQDIKEIQIPKEFADDAKVYVDASKILSNNKNNYKDTFKSFWNI